MIKVPRSYDELNYKPYVAIMNKIPSEQPQGMDKADWSRLIHMTTLSIVLGVPESVIEAMRASEVIDLIKAISFLDVPFKPGKPTYKLKAMNELTFDEFSAYQKLRLDQWNELQGILLIVLKDITVEQIDNMSIQEVMNVFFCLNKSTKRFLNRSIYLTTLKAIATTIVTAMLALPRKLDAMLKGSLKTNGVG